VGNGRWLPLCALQRGNRQVPHHAAGYGGPIAGFTRKNCAPISGDSQTHAVSWKEHATLDTLRDRFILLRVYGGKGLVFGFEIQNSWESTNAGSTLNVE
jgi:hypothetical protein